MQDWKKNRTYRKRQNTDGSTTFIITVGSTDVEVSEAVYAAYAQSERQLEYIEQDLKRDRVAQDAVGRAVMGTDGLPVTLPEREVSLEWLMDEGQDFPGMTPGPEDDVVRRMEFDRLRRCLDLLVPDERALVDALFFGGKTEREYAADAGIHYMTIHSRKIRILGKLKKLLEK